MRLALIGKDEHIVPFLGMTSHKDFIFIAIRKRTDVFVYLFLALFAVRADDKEFVYITQLP